MSPSEGMTEIAVHALNTSNQTDTSVLELIIALFILQLLLMCKHRPTSNPIPPPKCLPICGSQVSEVRIISTHKQHALPVPALFQGPGQLPAPLF